jgi:pyruvate/2-oxoglutarate dehydrogenase complex dihydrolipoamide acyltransferase (E2) component
VLSAQALAGVGASSSGVTTSTGDSTDPSADVQSQSSSFVQQNQQLSPNGTTPSGVVLSGGGVATQGTPAGSAAAGGSPGNGQPAQAAAPPAPPPPPPVYESAMRRLDRRNPEPPPMTVEASGPPGTARKSDATERAVSAPAAPSPAAPAPAKTPPIAARANPAADSSSQHTIAPPPVTGGRGAAPEGLTFYSGLTIAGALLAFGFVTFMRIGRNEDPE